MISTSGCHSVILAGASIILVGLFVDRATTTWPGLVIVLARVPLYAAWRKQ